MYRLLFGTNLEESEAGLRILSRGTSLLLLCVYIGFLFFQVSLSLSCHLLVFISPFYSLTSSPTYMMQAQRKVLRKGPDEDDHEG